MSNETKGSVICGHCGAVEKNGTLEHASDCPDRDYDERRSSTSSSSASSAAAARVDRVQLLERDSERLEALRELGNAGRGVINAILEGRLSMDSAARSAPSVAKRIDAVIEAGTDAAARVAQAVDGVKTAAQRWPGRDPLASKARFHVQRRVLRAGAETRELVGEAEQQAAADRLYEDALIAEAQRLATLAADGPCTVRIELYERRPGGVTRRRERAFDVRRPT